MKSYVLTFILFSFMGSLAAQYTGINTTAPITSLHVKSATESVLTVENSTPLNSNVKTGILFANDIEGPSIFKYVGAIKTIGTGESSARLGLFTYASTTPSSLIERLSILGNGNVGIGTTAPGYDLDVSGTTRLNGNVGINTSPSGSYGLSVLGSTRLYSDLRVDGILNPNNTLSIGNNTTIEGTLTVQNGKGIVRSTSGTQMKIKRGTINLGVANFGAGATLTSGVLSFGEDFAAVTVTVGQCVSGTGDWAKVLVVPFNVDVNANTCQFAVTNVSSSTITFDGSWQVVMVGN